MDPTIAQVSGRHRHGACVYGRARIGDWSRQYAHVRGGVQEREGLGECVYPEIWAPVGRLGEPDAEPTRGDKGQGYTASR